MSSNQVTAKQAVAANLKVDPSGVTSPVSIASLPLPTGAATETTLAAQSAKLPAALGQAAMAASLSVVVASNQSAVPVSGTVAVSTALALDATLGTTNTDLGGLTETAPATDTASSGLNGRLQRIAQRLTSLIALLPASLGQKTMANSLAVNVASDQSTLPVNAVGTATNASAQVTITNSSTTLIASRSGRRGVMVKNFQTVAIFVDASGGTATTSKSMLNPGDAQFYPVTSAITAITSAAYTASPATAVVMYDEYY